MAAFAVPVDQISAPASLLGNRFDIVATVPAGATKEQANQMLINLLKDRFHMAYHTEKKEFDLYTLVQAKGGSKLKDAEIAKGPAPAPLEPGTPMVTAPQDRDGFPVLPAGKENGQGRSRNGVEYSTYRMTTPKSILNMLAFYLGPCRTEDKTGLTGHYDFQLEFSAVGLAGPLGRGLVRPDAQVDPAPDLFTALEKQLGLKLEKSKTLVDVVVIDHLDRQPTGN